MTSRTENFLELQSLEIDLEDGLEVDFKEQSRLEIEVLLEDLGLLEFLRESQDLALNTKISEDRTNI